MSDMATSYIKQWVVSVNDSDPKSANWCASFMRGHYKTAQRASIVFEGVRIVWDEELPKASK